MKIKRFDKISFRSKYGISIGNMKILVLILLRRKLTNLQGPENSYYMVHPDNSYSLVPADAVSSLIEKDLLILNEHTDQILLTSKGFDLASKKLKDAKGSPYPDHDY